MAWLHWLRPTLQMPSSIAALLGLRKVQIYLNNVET